MTNKDIFIIFITKEIPRVLGALCQEWGQKTYISYKSKYYKIS